MGENRVLMEFVPHVDLRFVITVPIGQKNFKENLILKTAQASFTQIYLSLFLISELSVPHPIREGTQT